jgi:nucleotide-binding universal stress UspA family protein
MSLQTNTNASGDRQNGFRILIPLDGSELAAKAIPVAEALCRQLSAELHLVSVVPYLALPYAGAGTYVSGEVYQRIEGDREREARRSLEQAALAAHQHGVQTEIHLERGDVAGRVLDTADDLGIDLIVMTTHGRTGLARFALGSVADRVVRGGVAPVLLLHSFAADDRQTDFTDVDLSYALVPLDGSAEAEAPLFSIVTTLAGHGLCAITLLRVTDPRDGDAGERECDRYLEDARHRLSQQLTGRDCAINTVVLGGRNPAERIVSFTEEGPYHLVVMATHGEAGVGRWAFGSVTDRVLRDGKLPLLLAHPPSK